MKVLIIEDEVLAENTLWRVLIHINPNVQIPATD